METPLEWLGRLLDSRDADADDEDWCAGGGASAEEVACPPVATRRLWWCWCCPKAKGACCCLRTVMPPTMTEAAPGASCAGRAMSRWSARLRAAMWPEGGEETLEG